LGCAKEEISSKENNIDHISFDVELVNSRDGEDFVSKVKTVQSASRLSRWSYNDTKKYTLRKQLILDLTLANDMVVSWRIVLKTIETDEDLLKFYDASPNLSDWNWDYIDYDTEVKHFYQKYEEAIIGFESSVTYHSNSSSNFKVIRTKEVIVQGESKTYVEFEFSGDAFNIYDPTGKTGEVYKISNGIFKGMIE
jgi:hypothetical protein